MRTIVLPLLIPFSMGLFADCPPPKEQALLINLKSCKSRIFVHDPSWDEDIRVKEDVEIAIAEGEVKKLVVLDLPLLEILKQKPEPIANVGDDLDFYILGNPQAVCGSINASNEQWFKFENICCDTIPHEGICLLPGNRQFLSISNEPKEN